MPNKDCCADEWMPAYPVLREPRYRAQGSEHLGGRSSEPVTHGSDHAGSLEREILQQEHRLQLTSRGASGRCRPEAREARPPPGRGR